MELYHEKIRAKLPLVSDDAVDTFSKMIAPYLNCKLSGDETFNDIFECGFEASILNVIARVDDRTLPQDEQIQNNILLETWKQMRDDLKEARVVATITTRATTNQRAGDLEDCLTKNDAQQLIHITSSRKTTKLRFNDHLQFNEVDSATLDRFPKQLIDYEGAYEKNYLFVEKSEKIKALKEQFRIVEKRFYEVEGIKQELSRYRINELTENAKLMLIARIGKVTQECNEISLECLDKDDKAYKLGARLSEQLVDAELAKVQLFAGQYLCLSGTYTSDDFIIEKIYKKPSGLAPPRHRTPGTPCSDYLRIMAFNGPYNLKGSGAFSALRPILNQIKFHKPSLAILSGPFYSRYDKELTSYSIFESEKGGTYQPEYKSSRARQLRNFVTKVMSETQGKTKVMIIPDPNEVDCLYPLPLPKHSLRHETLDKYQGTCGAPTLFAVEDGRNVRIAYITGDVIVDLIKNSQLKNYNNKIEASLETLCNQISLYPPFPSKNPVDLSKLPMMSYGFENEPDILITSSMTPEKVKVFNGVLCINVKKVTAGAKFGQFADIKVDRACYDNSEANVADYTQVEIKDL